MARNLQQFKRLRAVRARMTGSNPAKEQTILAKPNYAFEKRKRELEQKRKKEEKLQKKMQNKQAKAGDGTEPAPATDADTPPS
jgi:hypothetical protein